MATILQTVRAVLRARGLRYRDLAERLGVSEVTVKRWMRASDLSLGRLSRIAEALGTDVFSLLELAGEGRQESFELTEHQERELAAHPRLLTAWEALRRGYAPIAIVEAMGLDESAWIDVACQLDALGLIELHPGNRVRLLHRGVQSLREEGPLARRLANVAVDWVASRCVDKGDALFTWSDRVVSPEFVQEAKAELEALARRWRDRAHRDQMALPHERCVQVRWMLLCEEVPRFPYFGLELPSPSSRRD
ncbi:MAG: helix-turn-helix transcriptional regulator [Myxococcota bacterium]